MSMTFDIVCVKCKKELWIGQGMTLYTRESDTMEKFQEFLHEHKSHPLMFVESNETYDFMEHDILPEGYVKTYSGRCEFCKCTYTLSPTRKCLKCKQHLSNSKENK